jgi:NADPH:quinone reductase
MSTSAPKIRAIVVSPGTPGNLMLGQVDAPAPLQSEALVQVSAISLNLGEVRRAQTESAGTRIGWDLAGTVLQAARDGKGPKAGTRVVGIVERGAWSAQVAVPSNQLAALPDAVTFAQAATLPVAALTALYALEQRGNLLQRRVLVTGASGGVGHFACQIARHSGAHVVALIRNPIHEALTATTGAHHIVIGNDAKGAAAHGPFDIIVDGVGGAVLGQSLSMLAKDGICVSYGVSAGAEVTFDARAFFRSGRPMLYGLYLFEEFFQKPAWQGLGRLADMIAKGQLVPHIDQEADWKDTGAVAQQLLDRRIAGKAVLHVH